MQHKTALAMATTLAMLGATHAQAQSKQDFDTLRAEIERLNAEVESLKKGQSAAAAPAEGWGKRLEAVEKKQPTSVVQGDMPGSYKLPGSDTSLKLYGLVRGDVMHDFKATAPNDNFNNLPLQPLDNSGAPTGKTKLTAELSRFGIRTSTPTASGAFTTRLEADFYSYCGSSLNGNACNRDRLRIRHAYGEYRGVLIGQTWSTFMDVSTLPETLDLNGPIGAPSWRRTMVRYTYEIDPSTQIAVALEEPRASSNGVTAKSPDVVARVDKSFGNTAALNLRLISHDTRADAGYSKRGSGVGIGASYNPGSADALVAQWSYVQGNGDLMWGSNGDADTGSAILLDRSAGVNFGWTHTFSPQWRTNAIFGMTRSRAGTDFATAYGASGQFGANKNLRQVYLNAFYTPVTNVDFGVEYTWGRRKTFADEVGTMSRLAFMGRYSF